MTEKPPSAAKAAAKSSTKGDDRNVVAVDKGYTGASVDDRIFLFWKNYRTQVIAVIVAAVLVIIGRYAWDAYRAGQENDIRAEYQKAKTPEAKHAFAQAHPGHPLAGVGLLAIADESYKAADYAAAQRNYADAAAALKDPVLVARAHLGQGMSAVQAGDAATGEPILRGLAADTQVTTPLRVEAWYAIAPLKATQQDTAGAEEALGKLMELKPSQMWFQRAMQLSSLLPRQAPPQEATPSVQAPGPEATTMPAPAPAAPTPSAP